MSVQQKLKTASNQYGVPSWIVSSIVEHESGFNPNAHGDISLGGSYGLFQLFTNGGLGDGYTPSQLKDPDRNISIAMPHIKRGYEKAKAKGLTGFALLKETASTSGFPLMTGSASMPSSYERGLRKTFENGDELSGMKGSQIKSFSGMTYKMADPTIWLTGKTKSVSDVLLGRMAQMAKEHGRKAHILSGNRTFQEQQYLYNLHLAGKGNLAAKPGQSNHENGNAIDVDTNYFKQLPESEFRKYGLHRPVNGENWHIEAVKDGEQVSTDYKVKELVRNGFDMMNIEELSQGSYSVFRVLDEVANPEYEFDWDASEGFGLKEYASGYGKAHIFRAIFIFIGVLIFTYALFKR